MVQFDMIYIHKETGKEFKGARLSRIEYKLIDPDTGEKFEINNNKLRREYRSDKNNRKVQVRKTFATLRATGKIK